MTQQSASTAYPPPGRCEKSADTDSYVTVWFRVAALVVTYYLLNEFIARLAKLSSDSYREPVLVVELVRSATSTFSWAGPAGPVVMAAIVAIVSWRYRRRLLKSWVEIDVPGSIRLVVVVVAGLLAWTFATYANGWLGAWSVTTATCADTRDHHRVVDGSGCVPQLAANSCEP